jgi:hypothetical protein
MPHLERFLVSSCLLSYIFFCLGLVKFLKAEKSKRKVIIIRLLSTVPEKIASKNLGASKLEVDERFSINDSLCTSQTYISLFLYISFQVH